MAASQDKVLRAITDDNTFRVIVATTTETVREALVAQPAAPTTARHYANLLTGTVLVRETMSPHHRVQGILTGKDGKGRLIADAHPDGSTRGLIQLPSEWREFTFGDGSVLQMMRSMANGGVYRGLVNAAGIDDVPTALMTYLQESEQIVSVIGAEACASGAAIDVAGGFVVQLLPEAKRDGLRVMTERLEALSDLSQLLRDTSGDALQLLEILVGSTDYAQLDDRPVRFHCWCTHEAVVATLATLGREELAEMARDLDVVEASCDYCHRSYRIGRAQLQGLLATS